jgi:hypothetical protein
MKLARPFSQDALATKHGVLGFCFRATFKWLALAMHGHEFKFEKLNVAKTIAKQNHYSQPFLAQVADAGFDARRPDDVDRILADDLKRAKEFLNLWGQKIKTKKSLLGLGPKQELGGISCDVALSTTLRDYGSQHAVPFDRLSAMLGFYMAESAKAVKERMPSLDVGADPARKMMTGHVIGLHGASGRLFDANHGEFRLSSNPLTALREIEDHIATQLKLFDAPLALKHCVILLRKS